MGTLLDRLVSFVYTLTRIAIVQKGGIIESASFSSVGLEKYTKYDVVFKVKGAREYAHAVAESTMHSVLKAFSEFCERYVIFSAYDGFKAGELTLEKHDFLGTEYKTARWVRGRDMVSQQEVLMPAQCVRRYDMQCDGDRIYPFTSSGVAAHPNLPHAIVNALCETIERDALLCFWYSKRTPTRVVLESLPRPLVAIVADFESIGMHIDVLNITTEYGVPAVCVVGSLEVDNQIRRCITAAARPIFSDAIYHALLEMMIVKSNLQAPAPVHKDVQRLTPLDRARLWRGEEGEALFGWFRDGAYVEYEKLVSMDVQCADARTMCEAIARRLTDNGCNVLWYQYPRVPMLGRIHVVKVLVPELFPFFLTEDQKRFGEKRLRTFCSIFNHEFRMNEHPHLLP